MRRMVRRAEVTIEDVALATGVSRQTVSRVINRSPNVKAAVRERVSAAIEQLGYVPNLSARRMGGGRSFLILAINDRQRTIENWEAGRGNDWVDQMLFGGMTECERHNYHLVFELIDADTAHSARQLSNALASLRPDGVILTPPHCDNPVLTAILEERSIPCARVGHSEGVGYVDVHMDEEGASHAATTQLITLGHRCIAFIAGAPNYGNSSRRLSGFYQAMSDAGHGKAAALEGNGDFRFDTAVTVIEAMLSQEPRPTAFIADNDAMAFAALHVASRFGLRVPEDVSIISFEDTPGVRFSVPPLTAIRQPTAAMIAKACEKLIAISKGQNVFGSYQLPFDLVIRESTGSPV
jgi:LacI family transcriptional regulator